MKSFKQLMTKQNNLSIAESNKDLKVIIDNQQGSVTTIKGRFIEIGGIDDLLDEYSYNEGQKVFGNSDIEADYSKVTSGKVLGTSGSKIKAEFNYLLEDVVIDGDNKGSLNWNITVEWDVIKGTSKLIDIELY